ncbi:MAG: hypothetical protein ACOC2W_02860, partial [bacterium]
MKKNSQATIFVILGIVILGIFGFLFYNTNYVLENEQDVNLEKIQEEAVEGNIERYVESCIEYSIRNSLKITFEDLSFISSDSLIYNGEKYYIIDKTFDESIFEQELEKIIRNPLQSCIEDNTLEKMDYIKESDFEVNIDIARENINVILNQKFIAQKGSSTEITDEVYYQTESHVFYLILLLDKIIYDTKVFGNFDNNAFMKEYWNYFNVNKHKPYPNQVYEIRLNEKNDFFLTSKISIEGEDSVSDIMNINPVKKISGFCNIGEFCFVGINQNKCNGEWNNKKLECDINDEFENIKLDLKGKDCGKHKHGSSWCEFDTVAGNGFDAVGSRHYIKSCFNGVIYNSECRDYREEFCTENNDDAKCVINRWWDCSSQFDSSSCLDTKRRDCYWTDWLIKAEPYKEQNFDYSNRKCVPLVPPGFKHWENQGQKICQMANEQKICDGPACTQGWIDSTAIYCFMQGDCGNYFNIEKNIVKNSFYNTNDKESEYVASMPLSIEANNIKNRDFFPEVQNVDDNRYNFLQGTRTYMKKITKKHESRMSTQINPIPLDKFASMQFDEKDLMDMIHSSHCSVWDNKKMVSNCKLCEKDDNKPCSEYRCKSLGRNCKYSEENGFGKCSSGKIEKKEFEINNIELYEMKLMSPKSTIEDLYNKNISKSQLINDYTKRKIELYDSNYNNMLGYESSEFVEPYTIFMLVIDGTEKMNCKISDEPLFGHEYYNKESSTLYPIIFNVKSKEDSIKDSSNYANDERVRAYTTQMPDLDFDEIKANLSDTKGINMTRLNEQQKVWENTLKPKLEKYLDLMQNINIGELVNTGYLFVSCENYLDEFDAYEFFIKLNIDDDLYAPKILDYLPKKVPRSEFEFSIMMNEPSECVINSTDFKFEMDCIENRNDDDNGEYKCSSYFEINKFPYDLKFLCNDKPNPEKLYQIMFVYDESTSYIDENDEHKLNEIDVSMSELDNNQLNAINGVISNRSVIKIYNPKEFENKEKIIMINESTNP